MSSSSSVEVPPLGKYLASSEKRTRDKAVKGLASFLSNNENNPMPDIDMAKLWKGVFYCSFWMSDKPRVQQALASELAELLLTITNVPSSLHFLRGFWTTMVREWNGIDRFRMDKYYMLVRRFVNASFRLLIRANWDESAIEEYNTILSSSGGPLCAADARVPTGLTAHLIEIYLEELDQALAVLESPSPAPLITLMSPCLTFAAQKPTPGTYERLQDALLQPLLTVLTPPRMAHLQKRARLSGQLFTNVVAKSRKHELEEATEVEDLRKAVLQTLFSIASAEDTRDSNRRKMYKLYQAALADDEDGSGG